jgi:hypothetical protein
MCTTMEMCHLRETSGVHEVKLRDVARFCNKKHGFRFFFYGVQ